MCLSLHFLKLSASLPCEWTFVIPKSYEQQPYSICSQLQGRFSCTTMVAVPTSLLCPPRSVKTWHWHMCDTTIPHFNPFIVGLSSMAAHTPINVILTVQSTCACVCVTNLEEHRQLSRGSQKIQTETGSQEIRDERPLPAAHFPTVKTQPTEQSCTDLQSCKEIPIYIVYIPLSNCHFSSELPMLASSPWFFVSRLFHISVSSKQIITLCLPPQTSLCLIPPPPLYQFYFFTCYMSDFRRQGGITAWLLRTWVSSLTNT